MILSRIYKDCWINVNNFIN